MVKIVVLLPMLLVFCPALVKCQGLKRNNLNCLSFSIAQDDIILQQSIGQSSGYTTLNQSGLVLRQGFIQPVSSIKSNSEFSSTISVWPNPAKDFVYVKLLTSESGQTPYTLYNSSGSIVSKGVFTNGFINTLKLYQLSAGVYTLLVSRNEAAATKIIITP